jgi:Ca2+/H+ antiporter, TMEM165/GDT1 family
MNGGATFATSFLASAVEAIEMVTIVVGVGAIRGWRSTLIGAGAGFAVLVVVGGGLGTALTAVPIEVLRAVIGALLLVFGLQWLRKATRRVARKGFGGDEEEEVEDGGSAERRLGLDWTAFVLAFKGVLLEGLEIAFIVITFGAAANQLSLAAMGGGSALALLVALGAAFHRVLSRIPRSVLMLVVGLLLSTFGSFWSAEGLGADWPGGDLALPVLLGFFGLVAAGLVTALREDFPLLRPEASR